MQGKRLQSKVIPTGVPVDSDDSPETVRRKGKPATERPPIQDADVSLKLVSDEKGRRRRLQDPLPLEVPSEGAIRVSAQQPAIVSEPLPHDAAVATEQPSVNPTYVPRSGYYFQHDDRTAPPIGRNNKRKTYDRSGSGSDWIDYRAKPRSGDWSRESGNEARKRDERPPGGSQNIGQSNSDGVWRHDRYFDAQAEELQDRRNSLVGERGSNNEAAGSGGKISDAIAHGLESKDKSLHHRTGKTENQDVSVNNRLEKRYPDGYVGRRERREYKDKSSEMERGRWMETDLQADRFQTRIGSGRPTRGRDRWGRRFDGSERSLQTNRLTVERWKHDMFDEANRSPTPKNEEDSIAKIEALLAA